MGDESACRRQERNLAMSHIWAARLAYCLGAVLVGAAAWFAWLQRG